MTAKIAILFFAILASFTLNAAESCVEKIGCELKRCEVEVRIIAAEKEKDQKELGKLNKTLSKVIKECNAQNAQKSK